MVPPALLLLALVALGVAAARPHREVPISSTATTVLLALDVSRSMCSTDVPPNRLEAAQRQRPTSSRHNRRALGSGW